MPRLQVRITKEIENDLDAIAMQTRTNRSHVAREALLAYIDTHLTRCHECNGTEIKRRDVHAGGRVIGEVKCADCGTEWEV